MSVFPHLETNVMARLGIRARSTMRDIRQEVLVEGQDWTMVDKRVCLSDASLPKILERLKACPERVNGSQSNGVVSEEVLDVLEIKMPPAANQAAAVTVLEVIRNNLANKHVLICTRPGEDPTMTTNWLTVRVRDSSNFLPKTATGTILARHIIGSLWEFAGNPNNPSASCHCPRFRGHW